MAKNILDRIPHLTDQELDYMILALAVSGNDYRALPREQRKLRLGFLSREKVKAALIKAEVKGRLPVGAADAIARKHLR